MRQLPGRPYLLGVRVQLFQHHLPAGAPCLSDPGWLLAAKAGAGVRISAHSWGGAGLQAPLVPEALGVLSWLEYQGCLVGESCTLPGAGSSPSGAWEHQA